VKVLLIALIFSVVVILSFIDGQDSYILKNQYIIIDQDSIIIANQTELLKNDSIIIDRMNQGCIKYKEEHE